MKKQDGDIYIYLKNKLYGREYNKTFVSFPSQTLVLKAFSVEETTFHSFMYIIPQVISVGTNVYVYVIFLSKKQMQPYLIYSDLVFASYEFISAHNLFLILAANYCVSYVCHNLFNTPHLSMMNIYDSSRLLIKISVAMYMHLCNVRLYL